MAAVGSFLTAEQRSALDAALAEKEKGASMGCADMGVANGREGHRI